jgi:hypothetical protein
VLFAPLDGRENSDAQDEIFAIAGASILAGVAALQHGLPQVLKRALMRRLAMGLIHCR